MNTKVVIAIGVVLAMLLVVFMSYLLFFTGHESEPGTLMLATTTSTEDSGLLDYILPEFEDKYNCNVSVIAVGSGQAMKLGKRGDVDVLLVHSPSAEQDFVDQGYGDNRIQVMYNNFVVVGPDTDPAGVMLSTNASDAFKRIYDNGTSGDAIFVSRADNSGTHAKELSVWSELGFNETEVSEFDSTWYKQSGAAMGAVLDMCEELDAYALSDDATYYARVDIGIIPHVNITYSGDTALFNQYSVMAVNSTMWPHVNRTMALRFVTWMTSRETQDLIASHEKYGHQLFFPNAPAEATSTWMAAVPEQIDQSPDSWRTAVQVPRLARDFTGPCR
ncbi:MAG TPA: substrate-binding domain-containing protein [Thermoplasmata archaeon]